MTTVLFAGPSIHGLDLAGAGDLRLAPPAACGDILRAASAGAHVIGLVDGVFGSVRAVWHKEILFALSQGVRVLGASSMGALRAAECDSFGMEGVGRIYEDYRCGRRTDDGDVALLHGPAEMGFCPLTVPLVDVDATVAAMAAAAAVSPQEARAVLDAARRQHFTRRTWTSVVAQAASSPGHEAALLAAVGLFKVEQKTADALALIDRLRAPADARPIAPAWDLNRTLYLERLQGEAP